MAESKPFCISKWAVFSAWAKVRDNKGAAGVDGVSIEALSIFTIGSRRRWAFMRSRCLVNSFSCASSFFRSASYCSGETIGGCGMVVDVIEVCPMLPPPQSWRSGAGVVWGHLRSTQPGQKGYEHPCSLARHQCRYVIWAPVRLNLVVGPETVNA